MCAIHKSKFLILGPNSGQVVTINCRKHIDLLNAQPLKYFCKFPIFVYLFY